MNIPTASTWIISPAVIFISSGVITGARMKDFLQIVISDPPLEGLGLPPAWLRPYKTLKILASFSAYALLTATFAKTVIQHTI